MKQINFQGKPRISNTNSNTKPLNVPIPNAKPRDTCMQRTTEAAKTPISPSWAKIIEKFKMSQKDSQSSSENEEMNEAFSIRIPLKSIHSHSRRIRPSSSIQASHHLIKPELACKSSFKKGTFDETTDLNWGNIKRPHYDQVKIKQCHAWKPQFAKTEQMDWSEKQLPQLNKLDFIIGLNEIATEEERAASKRQSANSSFAQEKEDLYLCDSDDLLQWDAGQPQPQSQSQLQLPHAHLHEVDFSIELEEVQEQEIAKESMLVQQNSASENENEVVILENPNKTTKPYPLSGILASDEIEIVRVRMGPWQLGIASLKQLVEELFAKKLIKEELWHQFAQRREKQDIEDFLRMFHTGKLHYFDYQNIKFTLLDHRRMAELLISLYPEQYYFEKPLNPLPAVQDFLEKLYAMSGEDYYRLFSKIDKISKIKWWGKILMVQEQRLSSCYKEKRVNQRRAERASLAVQEVIDSFRKKKEDHPLTDRDGQDERCVRGSKLIKQN